VTKSPRFTDDDIRAAFQLRAAGTPRHDLHDRIRLATSVAHARPTLVFVPRTERRRPTLARLAAFGMAAAILIVAPLAGVGSLGPQRADPGVGEPIPDERTLSAVAIAIEDDDDDEDFDGYHDDDERDDEDDANEEAREGNLKQ
jgi:hypothetical protein